MLQFVLCLCNMSRGCQARTGRACFNVSMIIILYISTFDQPILRTLKEKLWWGHFFRIMSVGDDINVFLGDDQPKSYVSLPLVLFWPCAIVSYFHPTPHDRFFVGEPSGSSIPLRSHGLRSLDLAHSPTPLDVSHYTWTIYEQSTIYDQNGVCKKPLPP